MKIQDAHGYTNDTLELSINIINNDPFISFQCDIILPDSFQYVDNSAVLTSRGADHVINSAMISNNLLRIFSYSLNNSRFLGDSGIVAVFRLIACPVQGTYKLKLQDGIIGDSLSHNILTKAEDGTIILEPSGIYETGKQNGFVVTIYPNPVSNYVLLDLHTEYQADIFFDIFDSTGQLLCHQELGNFNPGPHVLDISELFQNNQSMILKVCFCRIICKSGDKSSSTSIKIMVI